MTWKEGMGPRPPYLHFPPIFLIPSFSLKKKKKEEGKEGKRKAVQGKTAWEVWAAPVVMLLPRHRFFIFPALIPFSLRRKKKKKGEKEREGERGEKREEKVEEEVRGAHLLDISPLMIFTSTPFAFREKRKEKEKRGGERRNEQR